MLQPTLDWDGEVWPTLDEKALYSGWASVIQVGQICSVLPRFCTPISRLTLSSPHTRFHILPYFSLMVDVAIICLIADPMSLKRPKIDLPSFVLVSTHNVSSPIDHADMVARVLPQLLRWPAATTLYSYMTPFKHPGRPSTLALSVQPRCIYSLPYVE